MIEEGTIKRLRMNTVRVSVRGGNIARVRGLASALKEVETHVFNV